MTDVFVSPEWLSRRLGQPGVKIVDGSWHLPTQNRNGKAEFLAGHIPGAVNLPHGQLFNPDGTWTSVAELKTLVEESGLDLAKPVVTSCGSGMTASALAFGLHRLGKDDVALYDGSWSEWGADPDTPKATGAA